MSSAGQETRFSLRFLLSAVLIFAVWCGLVLCDANDLWHRPMRRAVVGLVSMLAISVLLALGRLENHKSKSDAVAVLLFGLMISVLIFLFVSLSL
jgi:hypothetical protein